MNDNLIGLLLLLGLFMALLFGASYGTYKYGRYTERRSLASVLKWALADAYGDGYKDGEGRGRTKGWVDGVKECDNTPLFSGRY